MEWNTCTQYTYFVLNLKQLGYIFIHVHVDACCEKKKGVPNL